MERDQGVLEENTEDKNMSEGYDYATIPIVVNDKVEPPSGFRRCFFWIAEEARYLKEAEVSAASVKRLMPDYELIIVTTNKSWGSDVFTGRLLLEKDSDPFFFYRSVVYFNLAFQHFYSHAFDRIVYMDTDTCLLSPIDEVFDMLSFLDIIGTHAPARYTRLDVDIKNEKIPLAFPEINIGVLGLRICKEVLDMLEFWLNTYTVHHDEIGNNDQIALRYTLWMMLKRWGEFAPRLYIMPPEYNMRFGFGGFAGREVKVLHGRSDDIDRVGREINTHRNAMRSWKRGEIT